MTVIAKSVTINDHVLHMLCAMCDQMEADSEVTPVPEDSSVLVCQTMTSVCVRIVLHMHSACIITSCIKRVDLLAQCI